MRSSTPRPWGRASALRLRASALRSWGRASALPLFKALPLILISLSGAACRQDMHDQPRLEAYEASDFFADGQGMRPIPDGAVARGQLFDDEHLYTGNVNGQLSDEMPFPVTREVLERGRERYTIYCTPCHGQTGMGNGMVVQRGYRAAASFHSEAVRSRPLGHYFDVMTNGFGAMPDYRTQVSPRDRWAVAAYIRVLQLSQRAVVDDVPEDRRQELEGPGASSPPPSAPATEAPPEGGAH